MFSEYNKIQLNKYLMFNKKKSKRVELSFVIIDTSTY